MALIFILHVIAIGILINRLPLRFVTVMGTLMYFVAFYLLCGHYLAAHRESFVPKIPLEDDYYRFQQPKKIAPFGPPKDLDGERVDEDADMETDDGRPLDGRINTKEIDQTKTNP